MCVCTVSPEREMMFRIWWSAFLAFTSGCYWGYEIAWNAGSFLSPIKPVRAFFCLLFSLSLFRSVRFFLLLRSVCKIYVHLRCKSLYLTKNTATFAPWNMWQFIMWLFFLLWIHFSWRPPLENIVYRFLSQTFEIYSYSMNVNIINGLWRFLEVGWGREKKKIAKLLRNLKMWIKFKIM